MTIRVAITGFGRIGRNVLRAHYENGKKHDIEIVAINATGDLETNAHLLRYDSCHGRFNGDVRTEGKDNKIGAFHQGGFAGSEIAGTIQNDKIITELSDGSLKERGVELFPDAVTRHGVLHGRQIVEKCVQNVCLQGRGFDARGNHLMNENLIHCPGF